MSIRANQSQQPLRSNTIYSSNSKGSLYPNNKTMITNSNNQMTYNAYGQREQHTIHTARQSAMSKSSIMKSGDNMDFFVKQTQQTLHKLQKRLNEHQHELSQLKKASSSNRNVDPTFFIESDFKQQNKIQYEIDRIRQQINSDYIRKDTFDLKISRIEFEILDKIVNKKQFSSRLQEIKERTNIQLQRVFQAMRNEVQNSIHQVHDVNRVVFSRIQKDMSQMKGLIDQQKFNFDKLYQQVQQESLPLYSGKKKCFGGIKTIRYQQTLQKIIANGQQSEQITINQCVYYLDRDGYLLDQNGYYLMNNIEQQIQLDSKQLTVLRKNNILF